MRISETTSTQDFLITDVSHKAGLIHIKYILWLVFQLQLQATDRQLEFLKKKSLTTFSLQAYARLAGSGCATLLVSSFCHLRSNPYIQSRPGFPFLNGLVLLSLLMTSCTTRATTSLSIPNPQSPSF